MDKNYVFIFKSLFSLMFFVSTSMLFAQVSGTHFTFNFANPTNPTDSSFEVDVILVVDPTGQALADGGSRISAVTVGINFNPDILNGGTPSVQSNSGTWEYLDGTRSSELNDLVFSQTTYVGTKYLQDGSQWGHLRIVGVGLSGASSIDIAPGTYRIGRYRFNNTVPFTSNSDPQLWFNNRAYLGTANTMVSAYRYGTTTIVYAYSSTFPTSSSGVSFDATQSSPLQFFRLNGTGLATQTFNQENWVVAWPNPVDESFTMSFDSNHQQAKKIEVYDMLGRLVETFSIDSKVQNSKQIGQTYPRGVYNIKIVECDQTNLIKVVKK